MKIIGLIGGMGAGKSFVAQTFREHGVRVFDADEAGRQLLAPGQAGAMLLGKTHPELFSDQGINRERLRSWACSVPGFLTELETVLHPLILRELQVFLTRAREDEVSAVVLDVPLLLETGWDRFCSCLLWVRTPLKTRMERARLRKTLNTGEISFLMSRQALEKEMAEKADVQVSGALEPIPLADELRRLFPEIIKGLEI